MEISNKYCFYAATCRGAIEYTFCVPNAKIEHSKSEESSEITAFEWGRSEDEIIIGYKSGLAHIYNTASNQYEKTLSVEGEGPVVGVGCLGSSVLVAREDGIVNIWRRKKPDYFSLDLDEKATLNCMVYNKARQNVIGTGGEFNDFKLWDCETQKCIFKAKSLGHDELNLPIPTSVRGIAFLPENERLSVCATKEGHVLLYDDRAQRRPVVKFLEKKASYTCIASAFRERQCLVGTTRGYMQLLDLKSPGKCLKTFTTFTGSITSIVCDPTEPLVASTSLDRYLRIHNLETKDLVYKIYLKQNLTKLLMRPVIKEEEEKAVDEEFEEIFNNMETIEEPKGIIKQKRKLTPEAPKLKKKKKAKQTV